MRIVFMGTPAFAVPPLAALLDAGFEVVACVTQPDRPSGRGNRVDACPVKQLAVSRDVPVLQFERVSRQEGLDALRALSPDLFVTAAFGQILSRKVLAIPPLGTVNLHASLLPAYRGPAPINWCVIHGETTTGVTTMRTDAGVDTGDILLSLPVAIGPEETAGELTERLSRQGASLLVETVRRIQAGDCPCTPQDHQAATHHPMLTRAHGCVDWTKSARQIANLVRGVDPWPGAFTALPGGGVLKIWKARPVEGAGQPGEILCCDVKRGLHVACGEGALEIVELQAENAKRMTATAYVLGHPMMTGQRLGGEENEWTKHNSLG